MTSRTGRAPVWRNGELTAVLDQTPTGATEASSVAAETLISAGKRASEFVSCASNLLGPARGTWKTRLPVSGHRLRHSLQAFCALGMRFGRLSGTAAPPLSSQTPARTPARVSAWKRPVASLAGAAHETSANYHTQPAPRRGRNLKGI